MKLMRTVSSENFNNYKKNEFTRTRFSTSKFPFDLMISSIFLINIAFYY